MSMKSKAKSEKSNVGKFINKSDSDDDEEEHELLFYADDRVKLMKEVLKIIKPKKIKSMAPDCIKDLDIQEINSLLLEELLGISNKRLKYIFNGQSLGGDSSSTDPEDEKKTIDIISLDDITDDDLVIDLDSDKTKKKKSSKDEPKMKRIKKEKHNKTNKKSKDTNSEKLQEENLMSVLELLELQARARAIRSQLILEANKKNQTEIEKDCQEIEDDSDTDAVIIASPKNEEIVITSSDSEDEQQMSKEVATIINNATQRSSTNKKKITLIRDRVEQIQPGNSNDETPQLNDTEINKTCSDHKNKEVESKTQTTQVVEGEGCTVSKQSDNNTETVSESENHVENSEITINTVNIDEPPGESRNTNGPGEQVNTSLKSTQAEDDGDDEIILIVDQDEIDNIIGD